MPDHGQRARYLRGCRCEPCRDAHRRYCKTYALTARVNYDRSGVRGQPLQPRRIPSGPVVAHLNALLASGWTKAAIVREVTGGPNTGGHIYRLLRGEQPRVLRSTAARILALEPLAPVEVDEVVVERLVSGADWRALSATRAEREAAVRAAARSGRDVWTLAARLGISGTAVRALVAS